MSVVIACVPCPVLYRDRLNSLDSKVLELHSDNSRLKVDNQALQEVSQGFNWNVLLGNGL